MAFNQSSPNSEQHKSSAPISITYQYLKGPVTYLLKPLLGKNFGGVAWTPFVMHWSFYSTVLPGDMQI